MAQPPRATHLASDGSAAHAAARAPALSKPRAHSEAGDVAPDARNTARNTDTNNAADATTTWTEHAAVDARARAGVQSRAAHARPHARRPLGFSIGRAVPALGADDAPILRAVGAGVAEF